MTRKSRSRPRCLPHRPQSPRQRGYVLLILLSILVVSALYMLVKGLNRASINAEKDQQTYAALAEAKAALIAYAVTYGDTHSGQVHGYLPCPDQGQNATQDGTANTSCGTQDVSQIGKLPWRTLGLSALRDANGECLWYAVSGTYKNNPKTEMMNWDNNGLFEVMASDATTSLAGPSADNRAVAVIFAPGGALGSQDRAAAAGTPSCGGNYTASNYLDNDAVHGINNSVVSTTANSVSRFIAGQVQDTSATVTVNDKVAFITKDDIFNAILRRSDFVNAATNPLRLMTRKTAECIADYGRRNANGTDPTDKRLPWAGRLLTTTDYWTDTNYDDGNGLLSGRVTNRVNTSDAVTINSIVSPYYQLQRDGGNCPNVTGWPTYYPWWSNWKDQLFYALAYSYRPSSSNPPPTGCGTCLTVNGAGPYAAVIMFAGKKLAGQARDTTADHITIPFSNYLEGRNLTNYPNSSGNSNYQSGPETGSFNDILYCIRPDLSVVQC